MRGSYGRKYNNAGVTEKDLSGIVIDLATRCGWDHIYHTWNSMHSPAGFPDLILLRRDRQVVVELKVGHNNLSADQYFWLMAFEEAGAEIHVWRETDEDWIEMQEVLK